MKPFLNPRNLRFFLGFVVLFLMLSSFHHAEEWGFFGHRKINRMAVFTLPLDILPFYKKNIEYITEHAVDPDKRRYATKHEAVRHYIDIDHWGTYPFPEVPRNWTDALVKYTDVYLVTDQKDTIQALGNEIAVIAGDQLLVADSSLSKAFENASLNISRSAYRTFFQKNILPLYYEDNWQFSCDSLLKLLPGLRPGMSCTSCFGIDRFSEYGILPYNLESMQRRLTDAFIEGDVSKILRFSADFGHYIGDAHVPLHTTTNYNGQLTNQVGIHAFWESRLPELFADTEYDFFIGKATYIQNINEYYWDIVLTSHSYVDSVLAIEKRLSKTFPQDQQFCFEERLDRTIRTQCQAYARAYHNELKGMVERRMRESILSIGSAWYTAWIDAGQPDMENLGKHLYTKEEKEAMEEQEKLFRSGNSLGRKHDNE